MKTVDAIYKNVPGINSMWMFYFITSSFLKSRFSMESILLYICIYCYKIQKNNIYGLFELSGSYRCDF